MKFPALIRSLLSSSNEQNIRKYESDSLAQQAAKLLESHSVICHCGGIAPPMAQTGYTYRCIRCNKTTHSIDYNLGNRTPSSSFNVASKTSSQILNMNYYDEAIRLLKTKR